jgi:hypothetical protein
MIQVPKKLKIEGVPRHWDEDDSEDYGRTPQRPPINPPPPLPRSIKFKEIDKDPVSPPT